MHYADVCTTMRYDDAFTSDMAQPHGKVVGLAMNCEWKVLLWSLS